MNGSPYNYKDVEDQKYFPSIADFVNILRCESECSAVPYRPISVINVPELGQQPYPGSFALFSCLIRFRATLDNSAVHCTCIIQIQP